MPNLIRNKRATFDYTILEKIEAGLVLAGHEVKSIRNGAGKLDNAFVLIRGEEALLFNFELPRYRQAGTEVDYEPAHTRKLLLKKREIAYLRGKSEENGLTIVPLSIYTKGRRLKIEIGVGRGKKKYDKRETLKQRDIDRDARRTMKELF